MVDLGRENIHITHVSVFKISNSDRTYLEILDDAGNVVASTPFQGDKNVYDFIFDDAVGRSVRVKKKGVFGTISIGEVVVYGYESAPRPTYRNSPEYIKAGYELAGNPTDVSWKDSTPPKPGSAIILLGRNAQRFQKWNKEYQLFQSLMGPFSIVNPSNGRAIAVPDGGLCKAGRELISQTDNTASQGQQFYLGYHGTVFSSICPGLVISVDAAVPPGDAATLVIKLDTFRLDVAHLKWSFTNGTMQNVKHQGMVVDNDGAGEAMTLQSNTGPTPSQLWKRINTRLMSVNGADQDQAWKQSWTASNNINLEEFIMGDLSQRSLDSTAAQRVTSCYKPNPAFSSAFDRFARSMAIDDVRDEGQCRNTREALGFDKDHPFDTELQENFVKNMCDPFFAGLDHNEPLDLDAPPQFKMVEYTPAEYEAVEYEAAEYETVDYEAFAR
jgi:hypothetical protein